MSEKARWACPGEEISGIPSLNTRIVNAGSSSSVNQSMAAPKLTPIPANVVIKRCPPAKVKGSELPNEYAGGSDRDPRRMDAGCKLLLGSGPVTPF